MNRRQFIAATGSAVAAQAVAAAADVTAITTQFLWIKNVEYAGFYIADAKGYYARAGIAPAFLAGGPNLPSVEAAVVAGRADVGFNDIEKITDAIAAGADFVVLGAVYQHSVGGILSLPQAPVHSARDLVGKRIGIQSGAQEYIDGVFNVNHLPREYTPVPVGFGPEPLLQGACDAYLCYLVNQPLILEARHIPHVVVSFDALNFPLYSGCLYASRSVVASRRDVLVRYLRATAQGWAENARNPDLGANLTVNTYGASLGLSLNEQISQNRAQVPLTQSDLTRRHGGPLWVSTEQIAGPIYRALRAAGHTSLPPVSKLVDLSLLQEAYAHGIGA
jgi:ABC-type nitrate/sulfonate/bicarbonate transport system substrate-binding protein